MSVNHLHCDMYKWNIRQKLMRHTMPVSFSYRFFFLHIVVVSLLQCSTFRTRLTMHSMSDSQRFGWKTNNTTMFISWTRFREWPTYKVQWFMVLLKGRISDSKHFYQMTKRNVRWDNSLSHFDKQASHSYKSKSTKALTSTKYVADCQLTSSKNQKKIAS